jgi:hypothetical protein
MGLHGRLQGQFYPYLFTLNIITGSKEKRTIQVGHVEYIGDMRNAHEILIGKPARTCGT